MSRIAPSIDTCSQRLTWADIDLAPIRTLVNLAKSEDTAGAGLAHNPHPHGDHSAALIPADQTTTATLRPRMQITVCGVALAKTILKAYDPELEFEAQCRDGDVLEAGSCIGTVSGRTRSILTAERPLLNFLQKLSGVATLTARYVAALGDSRTRILDTRKTTPGYRVLEKFAVACGGGWNHRIGLFDRVMLKDNHLAAFGSDPRAATIAAVAASRSEHPALLVEMEVDTLEQIEHALAAEVDIILLDNFSPAQLSKAVSMIDGKALTEASGNITLDALPELGALGLDFISSGATVHQSTWVDIGLDS